VCGLCLTVIRTAIQEWDDVRLELGPEDALNDARLEGETKSLVRGSGMHHAFIRCGCRAQDCAQVHAVRVLSVLVCRV
jgi:hypothetical protein